MVEVRVGLRGNGENDALCVWKTRAIENIAYLGCKGGFEKFEENGFYFESARLFENIEKFMGTAWSGR